MKSFVKVDLQGVFNHKAFLNNKEEMHLTGLDNQGLGPTSEFFTSADYPQSLETILIENVSFTFPDKNINKYDNVECKEQIVSIPEGTYNKVHFIGFSVYGNYNDTAVLKFKGEDYEDINISLLGWGVAGNRKLKSSSSGFKFIDEVFSNQERAVLFGKNTNAAYVGCTYWQADIENNIDILREIKLPDNSFMHICAITFES